jgi:hypothetical protein
MFKCCRHACILFWFFDTLLPAGTVAVRSNAARSAGSEAPPFERTVPFWQARFAVFVCFLLLFCSARLCPLWMAPALQEKNDTLTLIRSSLLSGLFVQSVLDCWP